MRSHGRFGGGDGGDGGSSQSPRPSQFEGRGTRNSTAGPDQPSGGSSHSPRPSQFEGRGTRNSTAGPDQPSGGSSHSPRPSRFEGRGTRNSTAGPDQPSGGSSHSPRPSQFEGRGTRNSTGTGPTVGGSSHVPALLNSKDGAPEIPLQDRTNRRGDQVIVPALLNSKDGAPEIPLQDRTNRPGTENQGKVPEIPVQDRAARHRSSASIKRGDQVNVKIPEIPVPKFREKMLITHRGLSGPAILQISSYWSAGRAISIDLAPGRDLAAALRAGPARNMTAARAAFREFLPSRLAARWLELHEPASWTNAALAELERAAHAWVVAPAGTEGYEKAEVTAGGVDTDELSSKTMESRSVPGLFFIGEVVDVTGQLGGHNFQWAWASGAAAGRAV